MYQCRLYRETVVMYTVALLIVLLLVVIKKINGKYFLSVYCVNIQGHKKFIHVSKIIFVPLLIS